MFLSIYLTIYLSISICLSIYLSIYISISICMITNIHSLHGLLHGFRKSCSTSSNSSQDVPDFPPNLCQNCVTSGEPTSAWSPRPSCEASCEAGWRSGGPKPSEVLPILRLILPLLLLMCYDICSGVDVYIVYLSLTKLMVGIYDWSYGLWQPIIYGIPIDQAVRWDVMCVISWLNLSIWEAATVVQWWLASTSMPESARDELLPGKLDATSTSHPDICRQPRVETSRTSWKLWWVANPAGWRNHKS